MRNCLSLNTNNFPKEMKKPMVLTAQWNKNPAKNPKRSLKYVTDVPNTSCGIHKTTANG